MYPAPQWMPLRQKWQLMHTYNFCQSSPQGMLVIKTQIFPAPWNALIVATNSKQQTSALRRCTALSYYIDFMQLHGWFWIFWQNSCRWKQDICCQRFHSSVNVHLNILAKTLVARKKMLPTPSFNCSCSRCHYYAPSRDHGCQEEWNYFWL